MACNRTTVIVRVSDTVGRLASKCLITTVNAQFGITISDKGTQDRPPTTMRPPILKGPQIELRAREIFPHSVCVFTVHPRYSRFLLPDLVSPFVLTHSLTRPPLPSTPLARPPNSSMRL